jgi:FkbM family methyltransferase
VSFVTHARFARTKAAVARALIHPLVGAAVGRLYRDRIPDRHGCIIRTPAPVTAAVKALLFWGMYESAEVRFVRRYLRRDLDVVELGSSIGVVGSHVARSLSPGRKLVCVEANPHLLAVLEQNVRLNAPAAAVSIVNAAISYDGGAQVELTLAETNLASSVGGQGGERVAVPTTSLSRLLGEQGIGEFCLISDIEGAEGGLIENDAAGLSRCAQIIIELHDSHLGGKPVSPTELAGAIEARGYRRRAQYGPVHVFERA